MEQRKQISTIFSNLVLVELNNDNESVDEMVKNYEELNEKCDRVISKIKERKQKKNKM